MTKTRTAALLTTALATAAGATLLAPPASAGHGGGGLSSTASVQLRLPLQALDNTTLCLGVDPQTGNGTDCQTVPTGMALDNIGLKLTYSLVRGENHLPAVDTVAGKVPATFCTKDGLGERFGLRILASGVAFAQDSVAQVTFTNSKTGEKKVVEHPSSPQEAARVQGTVLCLPV